MRPTKARRIAYPPRCSHFCPQGEASGEVENVVLTLDMYEAMRLVDGEGRSQEDAAQCMDVSTPTLCRILSQARHRVADALSHGKSITLQGGNIMISYEEHRSRMGKGFCRGQGMGHGRGQCRGGREGHGEHGVRKGSDSKTAENLAE